MPAKKRKPQARKRRTSVAPPLIPFKENMNTGESYVPRKRKAKVKVAPYVPPVKNSWDALEVLDLEELTRQYTPPILTEDWGFRRFLRIVVSYGLTALITMALATIVAWYVLEKGRREPVKMMRAGRGVVFAVGESEANCRVIVETHPSSTHVSINSTDILAKTPVKLLLPCRKPALVSLTAPGFIPVAKMLRPEDKELVRVQMRTGEPTITDDLKFNFMRFLQPFFTASHQ